MDHAEEIWQLLSTGKTQQQVGNELGWTREKIAQYAQLQKINANTWKVVVTTVTSTVTSFTARNNEDAQNSVTFSENLLRAIIPLKPEQQVADEFGWTREKIRNYANLESISPEAWKIIGTAFQGFVPSSQNNDVPGFGTNVPFTEGLLRNLLDLTEYHQLAIPDYAAISRPPLERVTWLLMKMDSDRRMGTNYSNKFIGNLESAFASLPERVTWLLMKMDSDRRHDTNFANKFIGNLESAACSPRAWVKAVLHRCKKH